MTSIPVQINRRSATLEMHRPIFCCASEVAASGVRHSTLWRRTGN